MKQAYVTPTKAQKKAGCTVMFNAVVLTRKKKKKKVLCLGWIYFWTSKASSFQLLFVCLFLFHSTSDCFSSPLLFSSFVPFSVFSLSNSASCLSFLRSLFYSTCSLKKVLHRFSVTLWHYWTHNGQFEKKIKNNAAEPEILSFLFHALFFFVKTWCLH